MKFILSYLGQLKGRLAYAMTLKFSAAIVELLLPRILTHIIDEVVPLGQIKLVIYWGLAMVAVAAFTAFLNITANRAAVRNAKEVAFNVRQDLFEKASAMRDRVRKSAPHSFYAYQKMKSGNQKKK